MSGYLLDTNVVSEMRKGAAASPRVRNWFASVDSDELFLSVLVLGEIRHGIELRRRKDAVAARILEKWLRGLEADYQDRLLPVDDAISDLWGRLSLSQPLPPIDGLMAATALHHRLVMVTRNVTDVARSGVECVDPFA